METPTPLFVASLSDNVPGTIELNPKDNTITWAPNPEVINTITSIDLREVIQSVRQELSVNAPQEPRGPVRLVEAELDWS